VAVSVAVGVKVDVGVDVNVKVLVGVRVAILVAGAYGVAVDESATPPGKGAADAALVGNETGVAVIKACVAGGADAAVGTDAAGADAVGNDKGASVGLDTIVGAGVAVIAVPDPWDNPTIRFSNIANISAPRATSAHFQFPVHVTVDHKEGDGVS